VFVSGRTTIVFVYGTLREGEHNHARLGGRHPQRFARTLPTWELVSLGSYPAILPGGTTAVLGEVYEVDDETLLKLDALEEHPTYYERTEIPLEDGSVVHAYVMARERVSDYESLSSGDWRAPRR